jgi:hypothetical protein
MPNTLRRARTLLANMRRSFDGRAADTANGPAKTSYICSFCISSCGRWVFAQSLGLAQVHQPSTVAERHVSRRLHPTTFSPAMFGTGATVRFKQSRSKTRASSSTKRRRSAPRAPVTTAWRVSSFRKPMGRPRATHSSSLAPRRCTSLSWTAGADNGAVPIGGSVSFYLIEAEEYQEAQAA